MGVNGLVARLGRTITWIEVLGYANVGLFLVFLFVLGTKRIPESAQLVASSVVVAPDAWTLIVEADAAAAGILERGQGHGVSFTFDTAASPAATGHLTSVDHVSPGTNRVYRVLVRVEPGTDPSAVPSLPAPLRARVLSSTFLQLFMRRAG